MATVAKDALYPGKYHLSDGRVFEAKPEEMPHYRQRLKDMLAAGLHIPVAWEHQSRAKPMTRSEWESFLAEGTKVTLGHTVDAELAPEGFLETKFEVPDEDDRKRLPKIRFVSPKIEYDFKDSTGKVWPGPSITHFAVTPRPVQHAQKPFALSAAPVFLSLAAICLGEDMPEEKEDKPEDKTETIEAAPEPKGLGLDKLLDALKKHNIVLGEGVTDENFKELLMAALETKHAHENGLPDEPKDDLEDEPKEVSMSQNEKLLRDKLAKLERDSLEGRIKALKHIPKDMRQALLSEARAVQLSFDAKGDVQGNPLLAKVEAYEALKGKGDFAVDLSQTKEIEPPYAHDLPSDREVVKAIFETIG